MLSSCQAAALLIMKIDNNNNKMTKWPCPNYPDLIGNTDEE
jgi:hypothetical protein